MPSSSEPDNSDRRASDDDALIGTLLDERYRIEQRIATGGFGAIYRARNPAGELVALKILHPRLTGDPNMVARFQREGATLIQLHDPHTVATYEVGETSDGTLYIAMELLSGESLHDRLRRVGALPWRTAVAIARDVCSSLAEAHALGVVHRDLKPANIHVGTRGTDRDFVKVIDFGIVRLAPGSSIDDGQELTFAGHMIGTYDYMSPEQIVGEPCHDRSDIYSLGVVTYEMLTGRRPFPKVNGPASMMTALLTQTPISPAVLAAIPPELDRVVMHCLEREPDGRFRSIVELARALDDLMARHGMREEVTVAQPARSSATLGRQRPGRAARYEGAHRDASGAITDDERTWIDPDPGATPDLDPAASTRDLPPAAAAGRPVAAEPASAAPTVAGPPVPPREPASAAPTVAGPPVPPREPALATPAVAGLPVAPRAPAFAAPTVAGSPVAPRAPAVAEPAVAEPAVAAPAVVAPAVVPREPAVAVPPVAPRMPDTVARAVAPSSPAALGATLRGVAVAPVVVRRHPRAATPPPAPRPVAPFEWPAVPPPSWTPPAPPVESLATGSARDLTPRPTLPSPVRSYGWLWLALAIALAGIAAAVLIAAL